MLTHSQTVKKIKSMTAKEIIMAMVDGLKNPMTVIDMGTFGEVYEEDGVCYGCAATNAICNIQGTSKQKIKNEIKNELMHGYHYTVRKTKRDLCTVDNIRFITDFEYGIDYLRSGDISAYNHYSHKAGFAKISSKGIDLPPLYTDFTTKQLEQYVKLANAQ